jgi:hypothetical protein
MAAVLILDQNGNGQVKELEKVFRCNKFVQQTPSPGITQPSFTRRSVVARE